MLLQYANVIVQKLSVSSVIISPACIKAASAYYEQSFWLQYCTTSCTFCCKPLLTSQQLQANRTIFLLILPILVWLSNEWVSEWVSEWGLIIGHYGDGPGPPGNHLHWYGQQKLTAKSIKPTQKTPKYNNILPTYTWTNIMLLTKDAHTKTNYTNTKLKT